MRPFKWRPCKTYKAVATLLILFLLLVAGRPFSAKPIWNRAFSFFGLGNFSSCADNWPVAVHILDVGKADSIFIECEGHRMLIDGGTPESGEYVARYLKQRGASHLEYVVNTHPDEDHIGGLKYVLNSFSVEQYVTTNIPPNLIPNNAAYMDTMAALRDKGLLSKTVQAGDKFALGNANIHVIGPIVPGNSTNNNSVILLLRYGNIRFLLTGDAEKEEEESLLAAGINLHADVLKVGHHGSNTSTTLEFLNAVCPKFAAISVGYDRNKLPKTAVLKRLYNAGVKTYRTDISGTILFLTDGQTISVETEK